ncbi:MAG: hypothetical protein KKE39_12685, partial [Bacteroidetes bacterium]|nr:hypothetical protein [Bacteroidota bacterium]MBU1760188.1 hypothetical protein [Bacteroidota bacterium]
FFIILTPILSWAQNISLTHSGTLYDASENPVQKSFQVDFSRKYQITILPALSSFIYFKGEGAIPFKKLLFNTSSSRTDISNIILGDANSNKINLNLNLYLFNFRIFKNVKYNKELGFSLQLKDEAYGNITDETFVLLDSYRNFPSSSYQNILNNNAENQSYWQLSVNYREDYNNTWAFGGRFSLLDGITYNKIDIETSSLQIYRNNTYEIPITGKYVSSFGLGRFENKNLIPDLKNMGAAVSSGVSYTSRKGTYLTLNVKDLGFIHWAKQTSYYNFTDTIEGTNTNQVRSNFFNGSGKPTDINEVNKSYNSLIDTKIDFAASKNFEFYTPVFLLSKSVFNQNGQMALLNNFRKNAFVFSFNPIYDFRTKWRLGSQLLIQSPNTEFYVGSESILSSYQLAKGFIKNDPSIGGSPKANFYIGFNVKFGRMMQTIGNADDLLSLNDKETGFVVRLSNKDKRAAQKSNKQIENRRKKNNKRNN